MVTAPEVIQYTARLSTTKILTSSTGPPVREGLDNFFKYFFHAETQEDGAMCIFMICGLISVQKFILLVVFACGASSRRPTSRFWSSSSAKFKIG